MKGRKLPRTTTIIHHENNALKNKVKCLDIFDPDYPTLLKEIACPPLVLYVKGSLDIFSKFAWARPLRDKLVLA